MEQITEAISCISSILSIPFAFSLFYNRIYGEVISYQAQAIYFFYILMAVICRILCLQLFAISQGPGKFYLIWVFVAVHICVIMVINLGYDYFFLSTRNSQNQ